jgi:hypothetical protein
MREFILEKGFKLLKRLFSNDSNIKDPKSSALPIVEMRLLLASNLVSLFKPERQSKLSISLFSNDNSSNVVKYASLEMSRRPLLLKLAHLRLIKLDL